jgi:hypothetical protein
MIINVKFDFDPEDGDSMYLWNAANIAAVKRCNNQRTELTWKKEPDTAFKDAGSANCSRGR